MRQPRFQNSAYRLIGKPIFLAAAFCCLMVGNGAVAKEFPGPRVKNEAPFNSDSVISGAALTCANQYDRTQFATSKKIIIADVKQCILDNFGITKDIGLDFGSGASAYSECVIPSSYEARPPSNNPMWPVCCGVELPNGKYRMACRIFFTAH